MRRIWACTVGILPAMTILMATAASAHPEISGEWASEVALECADGCLAEQSPLAVDVDSGLVIELAYPGLALTVETLWGLRGLLVGTLTADLEITDGVTLRSSATMAPPLDEDERIPPGQPMLVRSRVRAEWSPDGLELATGVVNDDVVFDERDGSMPRYDADDQRFRAGSVVTVDGETVGGVELEALTGFCFDPDPRLDLPDGSLDGEVCQSGRLQWSRSILEFAELQVSPSVSSAGELDCAPVEAEPPLGCEFQAEVTAASPMPGLEEAAVEWDFDAVYPESDLDEFTVEVSHRANLELELTVAETLPWNELEASLERAVHRGNTVWHGAADVTFERNAGLTDLAVEGGFERGPVELMGEAEWEADGGRVRLETVTVDAESDGSSIALANSMEVDRDGLDEIALEGTLTF